MKENREITQEDLIKIYSTMRSLYRFAELKEMGSPSVLIDNEKRILMRYLSSLRAEDILFLSKNFSSYYDEQRTQTALENEKMMESFDRYLIRLN